MLGGRFAVRHEIFEEQSRLVTSRFAWRPDASESFPLPPAETRMLALRALRELLDDPERNDWDDLLAANRALIKAIETGEPMTRRNARIVAEYLREAGWRERAIGAATAQAGAHAGTD